MLLGMKKLRWQCFAGLHAKRADSARHVVALQSFDGGGYQCSAQRRRNHLLEIAYRDAVAGHRAPRVMSR